MSLAIAVWSAWLPVIVALVVGVSAAIAVGLWIRRRRRRRAIEVRDAERMKLRAMAAADYGQSVRRGPWKAQ
jgi:type II secretory pathway pseudopilin PulG